MFVLKIGGSALTDKKTGTIFVNEVAERVARELNDEQCVIVHGVGYVGHKLAKQHSLHLGLQDNQLAWARLRVEVKKMTRIIVEKLVEHGVPAVEVSSADIMRASNGKLVSFDVSIIDEFVKKGFVPVMHADGALDDVRGLSVISGDTIVTELALKLGVSRIIYGTDVDGIYDVEGKVIPEIHELSSVELWEVDDFSGGMRKKIEEALRLKNVDVQVINLRKDGALADVLAGRHAGTLIRR
ncbi:MAG: hypothetical protein GXO25_04815 [Euryarchaeota archaeon]|nr:hypothetical protein [Euryarchaeota archaeon]